ncbi:MAG: DUF3047 domain-containing protein, partial [Methylobacter sp.]
MIGNFSSAGLRQWEVKKFKGETRYRLTEVAGETVLEAESAGTASGLYKKQ